MISNINEYLYLAESDNKTDNNRIINEELSSELILEIIKIIQKENRGLFIINSFQSKYWKNWLLMIMTMLDSPLQ